MKTPLDPRHLKRIETMQTLFQWAFRHHKTENLAEKVLSNREFIDNLIAIAAPQWPVERIANIDLSILRLAVFELAIEKTTPAKVIIDEAIELAKEFGNQNSPGFINGVLGTILKKIQLP